MIGQESKLKTGRHELKLLHYAYSGKFGYRGEVPLLHNVAVLIQPANTPVQVMLKHTVLPFWVIVVVNEALPEKQPVNKPVGNS